MSDENQETPPPKRGKRKLFLLVVLPLALLLLGGAGAAGYLMGVVPKSMPPGTASAETPDDAMPPQPQVDPSEIVFVNLPELLVNLNVAGKRLRFLKFSAALEVIGEDDAEVVRRFVPRVSDNIHLYLRALRIEELSGAEGVYRIKKDLLTRINQIVRPAEVREVLVKEMLVQ